jgi:hypothetical protein
MSRFFRFTSDGTARVLRIRTNGAGKVWARKWQE